jgi:class 3 adenylate cyclase
MVVVAAIFLCMTTVFGLILPLTELFGRFDANSLSQFLKMRWKKKDLPQWSQRHHDANFTPGANTSQSIGKGSGNPKSTAGSHATCLTSQHSPTTSFNKYLSRLGSSVEGDDVDEGRFANGCFDADHFENDKSGRVLNKQVVNQELRELKAVDFMDKKAETIRHQISATAKKSSWKRNIVMTVKKSYSWLTFGRAIKTERPSISRWEAMRWKSRSLTVLAVAVLTIVFCIICSVIYFSVGGWIAGLTILMHSIILVLCFVAIRYSSPILAPCCAPCHAKPFRAFHGTGELERSLPVGCKKQCRLCLIISFFNDRRVGSKTGMMSLTACMELVNYAQISLIMLVPMIMHVVLGGIDCGASSDWIIWTVLSPFIALFFIDGKHRTDEEKSNPFSTTYFNGFYFSKLVRQRRVRIVLWFRFVVFTFLIALDGSISRNGPESEIRLDDSFHFYDSPPWLKTMFFIMNHIFCPLCIIAASRVTVMEFLHRRALIIEMKVEVNVAENMNKNLLQSLVPKFLVPELVKTPPAKWHLGSKDVFRDCSIIQMDLVGFTALSGSIDVEELVELLNSLFTTIDQCAARLGNVWKVDTIGDCYIGVVGGPEPCKDHASRAVMLAHCIIDSVKKVGANLDHGLACRVGVHSGNVTAAFLGTIMPRYFIFGEDVNMTSMLETMGNPNEVHISASTAMALAEAWNARSLGQIELPRDSGNWVETYTINPSEDVSLAIGRLVDQDAAHCQALVKQWSSPDGDVAVTSAEMPPAPSPTMSVASAILRGNLTPLAARSRENSLIFRSETPKGSEGGDGSPAEALAAYSRSNKHCKDRERAKSYTVGENRGAKIEIGNNPSVRYASVPLISRNLIRFRCNPSATYALRL